MNPSWPDAATRDLQGRILAWMETAPAGFTAFREDLPGCFNLTVPEFEKQAALFDSLALELFAYQYERVPVYQEWCKGLQGTPATVHDALAIPALPVEAFRSEAVISFPLEHAVTSFRTSGTSSARTGNLLLDDLELYDTALLRGFQYHVLPDRDRMRMLQLIPRSEQAPHSSLAYMIDRVAQRWGTAGNTCFVDGERLQVARLQKTLQECAADEEPVLLLGTAFAWVNFLDACALERWRVALPPGSRLFETGGYKGRSRMLSRSILLQAFDTHLGIPRTHVVSEYGMTELGSQYYTLDLRAVLMGQEVPSARLWSYPMWLRPRLLHSESNRSQPLPVASRVGLLSHHDLANRGSVAHLLSADVGDPTGQAFHLLGRVPAADLRGCGLAQESLLQEGGS